MKKLSLACAAAVTLATGCTTSPSRADDHWNSESIAPRVTRVFLGYEPDEDGSYRDYQWKNKQHINLTAKRHFLNWNPDNPNHADDPSLRAPRPNHSLLPRPWNYIHLEGMAFAAIAYGAGGPFFPIPVDSLIGTLERGGNDEFVAGLETTFRPIGVLTLSTLNRSVGEGGPLQAMWRCDRE